MHRCVGRNLLYVCIRGPMIHHGPMAVSATCRRVGNRSLDRFADSQTKPGAALRLAELASVCPRPIYFATPWLKGMANWHALQRRPLWSACGGGKVASTDIRAESGLPSHLVISCEAQTGHVLTTDGNRSQQPLLQIILPLFYRAYTLSLHN
ncbi:hypothetical protein Pan181_21790 [Aeoliella mucimassa]|uniref:Uncharacterized protein n=1 Tax=Aeoliella mucimassa TaxID=2527972 RepID=A0A518AMM3_9BACT|nr:hypothetical protein Pan181_21790 [Aeoliella mucimassa]